MNPVVFISFSHDSPEHRRRVRTISERLRANDIQTILDLDVKGGSPPEKWPRWMLNSLDKATHVICVCTETYYRRFRGQEAPNVGKGADWEGALITQELYDERSINRRFIPVLFSEADTAFIPEPLRGSTHYLLNEDAAYRKLYDALLGRSQADEDIAADATAIDAPFNQCLGLVVGISEYEKGISVNESVGNKQFRNLEFAADDAKRFADFLREKNGIVDRLLLNAQASRRNIMSGLDRLHNLCKERNDNPLVAIYFSGHGVRDGYGRSYLLPHDADRFDPFSTAIWSETFTAALAQINTNRLVVFMDACHSGAMGAIEPVGERGASALDLEPRRFHEITNTKQLRTYVVASCSPLQPSLEADGGGIFTQNLLDLLRCKEPNEFTTDEVDLWDVTSLLKQRVTKTVDERFPNAIQEPYANFKDKTGIIVAINTKRKESRKFREQSYFDALKPWLHRSPSKSKLDIELHIEQFLDVGPVDAKLRVRFYSYFAQRSAEWTPGDDEHVEETCGFLIRMYEKDKGHGGSQSALVPASTAASPQPRAMAPDSNSNVAARPERNVDGYANAKAQVAPSPLSNVPARLAVSINSEKRLIAGADCDAIMDQLIDPTYGVEASLLLALLEQKEGVSFVEYNNWWRQAKPGGDVKAWQNTLREVGILFKKAWESGSKGQKAHETRATGNE